MTNYTVPHVFTPGTKAKANEVNENFKASIDAINTKADLSGNETVSMKVADATEPKHAVNKSQLEQVQTDLSQKLSLLSSVFCARSGNITQGKADLLSVSGKILSFKVSGSYPPLVLVNIDGAQIEVSSLADIDLMGKADGEYNVFITNEKTAYVKKNKIYRKSAQPTMLENDVWLDCSHEPLNAFILLGAAMEKFSDIPVGEFKIEEGIIKDVTTFVYSQNGYDINSQSFDWKNIFPDFARKSTRYPANTVNIAPDNGFIYGGGDSSYAMGGTPISTIKINGCIVGGAGWDGSAASKFYYGFATISKGDTFQIGTNSFAEIFFVPSKGNE